MIDSAPAIVAGIPPLALREEAQVARWRPPDPDANTKPRSNHRYLKAVLWALILGSVIRATYLIGTDFPLTDGGLFQVMIRELQANHFRLPQFTSYNHAGIPFAYPPLAFYLTGLLSTVTGWSVTDILHWLPAVLSLGSFVAFAAFANSMLSGAAKRFSLFAFSVLPLTFTWAIMGGGITRSLGDLFSYLAIWRLYELYKLPRLRNVLLAAMFSGLTVLSHPEAALFTVLTGALLFAFYGRSRRGATASALVVVGTVMLASPWWAVIVSRHGLGVFRTLGDNGFPMYSGALMLFTSGGTDEKLFPVLAMLSVLGVIVCLAKRRYFLPVWLALTFLLESRAPDQRAVVILALLIGVGVEEGLLRVVLSAAHGQAVMLRRVVLAAIFAEAIFGALVGSRSMLERLAPADRAAMQWVSVNTPAVATFLVVGGQPYGEDSLAEWFPALTDRVSLATHQGYEWLPGYSHRFAATKALRSCGELGTSCIDTWVNDFGPAPDYLYLRQTTEPVANGNSGATLVLETEMRADSQYALVYDEEGTSIFRRL